MSPNGAAILISVRNLNKEFRMGRVVVQALKDVNVEVYEGEYLSIMGPSGSGKTTLFNMVGALDRPTSGEVTVAGVDLTRLSAKQLAYFRGNHIGYVFQTYNLIPAYSAVDNVAMPLIFSGVCAIWNGAKSSQCLGLVSRPSLAKRA